MKWEALITAFMLILLLGLALPTKSGRNASTTIVSTSVN